MIAVVGDLLLDIFLLSDLRHEEQPEGIVLRPGGSAANTAAWLAFLGLPTLLVARVGSDAPGAMLVQELVSHGVKACIQVTTERETGAVAVKVDARGERTMRSARGANALLRPEDVDAVADADIQWVHVTGYALLGQHGGHLLAACASLAARHRVPFSFDPSSVGVIHAIGSEDLRADLRRCGVTLLLPNVLEAATLSEMQEPDAVIRALRAYCPTVIVKCGARGAVFGDANGTGTVETKAVTALDTTGAGDAFNAGVVSALVRGLSLREACRLGHATARQTLSAFGGRPPIKPRPASP